MRSDMIGFSKNKWKYSTIGLLAVLAIGFSFPQASAHMTNNVMHMLTHVFDNTEAIKAKTDNLPNDTASQSGVEDAMFSQIQRPVIIFGNPFLEDSDEATCTSDSDFTVHVSVSGDSVRRGNLIVEDDKPFSGGFSIGYAIDQTVGLTFGSGADEVLVFKLTQAADATAGPVAMITLQTTQGATASCEVS